LIKNISVIKNKGESEKMRVWEDERVRRWEDEKMRG